jgi:hypothetical protein
MLALFWESSWGRRTADAVAFNHAAAHAAQAASLKRANTKLRRQIAQLETALASTECGFNWSMQHNDCLWRKECWHEAKTADLLHRSSESTDVGSLESWRYLARDRQAV